MDEQWCHRANHAWGRPLRRRKRRLGGVRGGPFLFSGLVNRHL